VPLIVQHTYGNVQDMGPILDWCHAKGIPVIEDCCHVFGSRANGKLCGTMGDAAFFSGQWNKPFITGLGGVLLVNRPEWIEPVKRIWGETTFPSALDQFRLKVQIRIYHFLSAPRIRPFLTRLYRIASRLGFAKGSSDNAEFRGEKPVDYFQRMAPCQEQAGEKSLSQINTVLDIRKENQERLMAQLKMAGFRGFEKLSTSQNILLRIPFRVRNKEKLLALAWKKGFEIGDWFESPLHPLYEGLGKFNYQWGDCLEAEKASREVVNLSTYPPLSEAQMTALFKFLKKFSEPV